MKTKHMKRKKKIPRQWTTYTIPGMTCSCGKKYRLSFRICDPLGHGMVLDVPTLEEE